MLNMGDKYIRFRKIIYSYLILLYWLLIFVI